MLRVSMLVLLSGCAPAVSSVSATFPASPTPNLALTEAVRERGAARPERAARLAPPFGRSAGVRRVTASHDAGAADPTVIASVEPLD